MVGASLCELLIRDYQAWSPFNLQITANDSKALQATQLPEPGTSGVSQLTLTALCAPPPEDAAHSRSALIVISRLHI